MSADELSLPDDMDQLKSMVRAMAAQASRADALECEVETLKARNADADERIKRLMQILKAYDRARFGRRSEQLGSAAPDDEAAQQAFLFEEIETGISALRARVGTGHASQHKRASRPRKRFPPHLERVDVVIEPEDLPEHAGKHKVLIGEDVSERPRCRTAGCLSTDRCRAVHALAADLGFRAFTAEVGQQPTERAPICEGP